jgi:nitrate/nitrite-specific signal transduction histidine kinase
MSSQPEETPSVPAKSEELLDILRKGRTFAEELLRENERLRLRILQLENERMDATSGEAAAELDRLRVENGRLRDRLASFESRYTAVETENQDFARRFVEVEQQNEALANLYVASYQLHSTLDPSEVTQSITDIVVGLIGASEFAVLLVDEESNELVLTTGESVEGRFAGERSKVGEGLEGRVAESRQAYFGAAGSDDAEVACVPLMLKGECVGVIGIYRMLSQKRGGFTPIDHELLNLLAGQAATALVSSRLYAAQDRRLKTMEGFIKLLKES